MGNSEDGGTQGEVGLQEEKHLGLQVIGEEEGLQGVPQITRSSMEPQMCASPRPNLTCEGERLASGQLVGPRPWVADVDGE